MIGELIRLYDEIDGQNGLSDLSFGLAMVVQELLSLNALGVDRGEDFVDKLI